MFTNSCACNLNNSYCFDVYGCFDNELIIKAGLTPANLYDVYIENHFGNLFKVTGIAAGANGELTVPLNELPAGLISIVSENLLVYVTAADDATPVKLTFDNEEYDNVLLKFHGGNAVIITIQ